MIGQKLSPVLVEIESALWEFEQQKLGAPEYTDEGFRASLKIFMSTWMERIWQYQELKGMDRASKLKDVEQAGGELRSVIKKYTSIDPFDMY